MSTHLYTTRPMPSARREHVHGYLIGLPDCRRRYFAELALLIGCAVVGVLGLVAVGA